MVAWAGSIGVITENTVFVTLIGPGICSSPSDVKHTEASVSLILMIHCTYESPRSLDFEILMMLTRDRQQTDKPIALPLALACRVTKGRGNHSCIGSPVDTE